MNQFVSVRMVQGNAMDLALFQFDYDLTFAAFFLNADKTIYGRFGTRSSGKEAQRDITTEGFAKALQGALDLHAAYPGNKASLQGKHGSKPRYKVPERFPSLRRFKPQLDYGPQVAKSCVHCHQIGAALRRVYRDAKKAVPDEVLFAWPMPDVVGLSLDPREKARVVEVKKASAADQAGFRKGDDIVSLRGQPLLSIADVQWVLHTARATDTLPVVVRRGGEEHKLHLALDVNWRRRSNISWRTTSWDLRRMATGGMVLEDLGRDKMALRVKHVGRYGDHAVAMRAGVRKGDIVVAFDRRTGRMTESEIFAYVLGKRPIGTKVPVTLERNGKRIEVRIRMQ